MVIKTWVTSNFLLLNPDNMDVIVLGTQNLNQMPFLDGVTLATLHRQHPESTFWDSGKNIHRNSPEIVMTTF